MNDVTWTTDFLKNIAPKAASLVFTPPLLPDEAHWFRKAVELGVISVGDCRADCRRPRVSNEVRRDEFVTPDDELRHLLSFSASSSTIWVNRECIPHIAAVARLILHFGFNRERYSLSRYRTFQRDCVNKKRGQSYETDAEFYLADDSVLLQVEAKTARTAVSRIAQTVDRCATFADLPTACKKELEYVLDIGPKHLWLVAPGCVDPERYVYAVRVEGTQAEFRALPNLAAIPGWRA